MIKVNLSTVLNREGKLINEPPMTTNGRLYIVSREFSKTLVPGTRYLIYEGAVSPEEFVNTVKGYIGTQITDIFVTGDHSTIQAFAPIVNGGIEVLFKDRGSQAQIFPFDLLGINLMALGELG